MSLCVIQWEVPAPSATMQPKKNLQNKNYQEKHDYSDTHSKTFQKLLETTQKLSTIYIISVWMAKVTLKARTNVFKNKKDFSI